VITFLSSQGITVEHFFNRPISDEILAAGVDGWMEGGSWLVVLVFLFLAESVETIEN
jgi:hypothetical protein